ncbi:MAG: peptidoglycan bridge formation glycyltransferase FemA/FemB family protein [Chloroflexi bacterium]|nr:peptidoglycan bridge formation glycyltransferase FemA/FemB family protein [Chloroflexota bacterium]
MCNDVAPLLVHDRHRWNSFAASRVTGHLLQSWEWGELKKQFGWQGVRVAIQRGGRIVGGGQVLFRPTPLGTIAYIGRGPVIDWEAEKAVSELWDVVHQVCRRHGAFFLKVEPNVTVAMNLSRWGFRPNSYVVQPKTSIHIDLAVDLDTIAQKQRGKTRYNIGLASRKGVQVSVGTERDIAIFYLLLEETSRRNDFPIHNQEYYEQVIRTLGDQGRVFVATFRDTPLAVIYLTIFGGEAIYMYGASANVHRNLMPNHLLQWEAIKWAKEQGCTRYDMWGIPDEEALRGSRGGDSFPISEGVHRFKRGFGGEVVRYVGAFDYVYSFPRYLLWNQIWPRWQRWRLDRFRRLKENAWT